MSAVRWEKSGGKLPPATGERGLRFWFLGSAVGSSSRSGISVEMAQSSVPQAGILHQEEGGWGGCAIGSVSTADKKIQAKELSFIKCPKTLKSGTIIV